ncbi:MAG: STAS domain-containing protein [Gammaproteobacteria bacterium]|nr:STAS domain-containing protein [Gammaproteobacteria bacterium]
MANSALLDVIEQHESEILDEWTALQQRSKSSATGMIGAEQRRRESADFLRHVVTGLQKDSGDGIEAPAWDSARDLLGDLSRSRARQGFTPSETAMFVLSLKQPLFDRLSSSLKDAPTLARELWDASRLLDGLGLYTTEVHQKGREDVIRRQQQELLELSTPVIRLWDGILAVPLIGTLDSARTQVVMESLLSQIVTTGASIAVIDITGVPTVDTLVAQHLLKTVSAARLMGADCIISGIRPQIAQTIVHLGVDLGDVTTKASLAEAFRHALAIKGLHVQADGRE